MRLLTLLLTVVCLALPAIAQEYPTTSIKLVVPFPAGGPVDLIARVVADKTAQLLGQPIVIESRSGAGGVTGTNMVARAEPDGYTIALTSAGALAISQSLQNKVPYDPFKDLQLLTLVAITPEILVVGPGVQARTLPELMALAKASPGKLNFASTGQGSMSHLSSELFRQSAGLDIVHVPYSGAAPAVNDLVGGHVQMLFADIQVLLGSIQSGQLKALANGGAKRAVPLPEVATLGELGLAGVEVANWYGLVVPAATPKPIAAKLTENVIAALKSDEVKGKLVPNGAELVGNSPAQFAAFVKAETEKWAHVIRAGGIKGGG